MSMLCQLHSWLSINLIPSEMLKYKWFNGLISNWDIIKYANVVQRYQRQSLGFLCGFIQIIKPNKRKKTVNDTLAFPWWNLSPIYREKFKTRQPIGFRSTIYFDTHYYIKISTQQMKANQCLISFDWYKDMTEFEIMLLVKLQYN